MATKIKAYCKFNLFLKILGYSPRHGKHRLFSLFVLAKDFHDTVAISETGSGTVEIVYSDGKGRPILIPDSIVHRTVAYFERHYGVKAKNLRIAVTKNIPTQAGLGGGSSDAAAVLSHLYEKFKIKKADMIPPLRIALDLGSDVPFFLSKAPSALVGNFGDAVAPIILKNLSHNIIINNEICDTRAVFAQYRKSKKAGSPHCENDLMPAAFALNPRLKEIYESLLKKHDNVVMSGSGSSFVAIDFPKK